MKIRNGFISNSSSSSFIISGKIDALQELKNKIFNNIGRIFTSSEDYIAFLKKEYDMLLEEIMDDKASEIETLNNGGFVFLTNLDYGSESVIRNLGPNLKVSNE